MSVETATYISDLNATYPASGDPKSEGDDHLRLIKSTVKATFPNVSGAVTPTHTELNYVDGVTSAIQTQLNAKAPIASPTFTGTVTVPTPSASTDACTKGYADGLSFASVLPAQTGNSGKFVTTDGTTASWATVVKTDTEQNWTAQQTFKEVKDTTYTITDGAAFEIDPANGSIQTITLGASRTPKATNFESGQAVLLGIDDGTAYTITWTDGTLNPTWVKTGGGAVAPTLATSGYTWVLLWKVSSTMYGALVGSP